MTGKVVKSRRLKKNQAAPVATEPYQPTTREQAAAAAQLERRHASPAIPRLKIVTDKRRGIANIEPDHADRRIADLLLMEALGTTSADFSNGIINGVVNATTVGATPTEAKINFAMAAIRGIAPRDELEAMLAAQMTVVHMALMTSGRSLTNTGTLQHLEAYERTFNKLARTFASQLEALKRYRTGGEQTVRVEHVTVSEGGQAIIGNVSHGGGGSIKKTRSTP
jgi:hypothetical protein